MGDPDPISRGDWESILHAPFHVYMLVAPADAEPSAAQFRRLSDEIAGAPGAFGEGTIGRTMAEALAGNLEPLWIAYQAAGRSPKDGLKRVTRALRKAPESESIVVRDWLLALAVRIADARRELGGPAISANEDRAVRDAADWLDRPPPETLTDGSAAPGSSTLGSSTGSSTPGPSTVEPHGE